MRTVFLTGYIAAVLWATGCDRRAPQVVVERQGVERLIGLLRAHEREFPSSRPTNLAQIFSDLHRPYPDRVDSAFRRFGKDAGFNKSFFEKYVFTPPGISDRSVEGEIVFLNAYAFPDRDGNLGRMVVSKIEIGAYRAQWLEENRVQQIFGLAKVAIPALVSAAPVSQPQIPGDPTFLMKMRWRFFDFAAANHFSAGSTWAVWYLSLSIPVVVLLSCALWLWSRSRN